MGNIYGYFLILKDYRFMIYKHINPDNGRIFASVSPGPSGCYVGYWIVGFWDVGDLCGEGGGLVRGGVV